MKAKCENCKYCKLIEQNNSIKCDYLSGGYNTRPKFCPNFIKKNSKILIFTEKECLKLVLEERELARKTLWARIDIAITNIDELDKQTQTSLRRIINTIYVDEQESDKEV